MKKLIVTNLILLCLLVNAYSQSIPSYVPTNGLVAWWPFNGNANDQSGNGNNGTVSGATLTTDRFGDLNNAYSFNNSGNGNYITVPNSASFNFNGDISFSIWVKASTSQQPVATWLMKFTGPTPFTGFSASFSTPTQSSGNAARWDLGNGNINQYNFTYASTYGGVVKDGTWRHVVGTFSNNIQSLYVDGILVDTTLTPNGYGANSNPLIIGKDTYTYCCNNPPRNYNGLLDDIAIWNRALTQQEITNLFNAQNCNSSSNIIISDGPTTFCAGNSVNLTSDVVGGTYQWKKNGVNISTNATSRTYKASSTGSYTCVATCNGTALTSNAIAVTSKTNAAATVSASGATSFCAGDSVTLNCTNLGSNYSVQWYRTNVSIENATNYSQIVKQPGTYKVVTRNLTNGCSRISSSAITTNVNCRIANYSNITTTDDLNDDARFDATELSNGIKIYPNPNNGSFQFKYEGEESGNAQLEVINTMGQVVYQTNVNIEDGFLLKEIMLGDNFQKGIYIVRLLINGGQNDSRVLIQ
jgi:hypothetical protein